MADDVTFREHLAALTRAMQGVADHVTGQRLGAAAVTVEGVLAGDTFIARVPAGTPMHVVSVMQAWADTHADERGTVKILVMPAGEITAA